MRKKLSHADMKEIISLRRKQISLNKEHLLSGLGIHGAKKRKAQKTQG
jgi:hypothetical protein